MLGASVRGLVAGVCAFAPGCFGQTEDAKDESVEVAVTAQALTTNPPDSNCVGYEYMRLSTTYQSGMADVLAGCEEAAARVGTA